MDISTAFMFVFFLCIGNSIFTLVDTNFNLPAIYFFSVN